MTSPSTPDAPASALHRLVELGWHPLDADACLAQRGSTREVLLRPRLIEVLQARRFEYQGREHPLSPSAIDQILRELATIALGDGLLPANKRLFAKLVFGVTVTEFMPDGRTHRPTIALIDWTRPDANRFEITGALPVLSSHGTHERAPDLVGYVNGIPLVVIEAPRTRGASSAATLRDAIHRQLENQREDEIPQLFAYAQLLLALSGTDGRYGTTRTPVGAWARWSVEEEFVDAGTANAQDRLLASLLTPSRLLELVRGFVLFDGKAGKIVARHPQFFAVRALLKRLALRDRHGAREGGVVWHTTGSGKSLTMVFLAKALLLDDASKECRLLVVTDRLDLERQLARNFMSGGAFGASVAAQKEGERSKAATGRDLARRIGHGTERIGFALVQKFLAAARLAECRNDSADIVVLVDEGHRSHDGEMHERMRKALPRAACIAFTGTPLLKHEKTANRFGPIVHAYTMQRAIDDRAVLPLFYEERVPELRIDAAAVDRWFDAITAGLAEAQREALKRKHATSAAIHGTAGRIELIAWDIALHFSRHFKAIAPGLKGQVATANQADALRYKKALDTTGLVTSVVVIDGGDAAADERRALQAFCSDGDPDLLIVVDRLLTGFDEPRNAVLYIDKPLKGHGLVQAVSRVNRLHEGKHHGLLVDYRGVLKELDIAIGAYQDLSARTQGGFDVADLEGLYEEVGAGFDRLPELHAAVWSCFEGVANRAEPEQLRQSLNQRRALRDDFDNALAAFASSLRTALSSRGFFQDPAFSEAALATWKADLKMFAAVRQAARRDAMETDDDDGDCAMQIGRMLDAEVIGDAVREPEARYAVHRLGAPGPAASTAGDKARSQADLVRTTFRSSAQSGLAGMHAQESFSALIERVIARDLDLLDADSPHPHADRARAIGRIVDDAIAEHSLHAHDIESAIRKNVLQLLYAPLGLEKASRVAGRIIEVVRVDLARRR